MYALCVIKMNLPSLFVPIAMTRTSALFSKSVDTHLITVPFKSTVALVFGDNTDTSTMESDILSYWLVAVILNDIINSCSISGLILMLG